VSAADVETVTRLLAGAAAGDRQATEDLLPLIYEELRRLAGACFAAERTGHTLQPTALVHEAYLRLVDQRIDWAGRGQFFAYAASAMRNILVDHARRRDAGKRGGGWRRVDEGGIIAEAGQGADRVDVIALDQALERLAALDPDKARLVELRFFAGLSGDEAAEALGISRSTAAEHWRMARAWLHRALKEPTA
jgi:RNA polymerase sigma factor (TIGR02999 family)